MDKLKVRFTDHHGNDAEGYVLASAWGRWPTDKSPVNGKKRQGDEGIVFAIQGPGSAIVQIPAIRCAVIM